MIQSVVHTDVARQPQNPVSKWIDGWILLAKHHYLLDNLVSTQLALQIAQFHTEQDWLPDQLLEVLIVSQRND